MVHDGVHAAGGGLVGEAEVGGVGTSHPRRGEGEDGRVEDSAVGKQGGGEGVGLATLDGALAGFLLFPAVGGLACAPHMDLVAGVVRDRVTDGAWDKGP